MRDRVIVSLHTCECAFVKGRCSELVTAVMFLPGSLLFCSDFKCFYSEYRAGFPVGPSLCLMSVQLSCFLPGLPSLVFLVAEGSGVI